MSTFRANRKKAFGFTFIELLVIIGITVAMASISIPMFNTLQMSSQLNESVSLIMQEVRLARDYSMSGLNNSSFGVFFELNQPSSNDRIIFYQGDSYSLRNADYDRQYIMNSNISLITELSDNEIHFSRGLAEPSSVGNIVVSHGLTNETRTIKINLWGIATKE
jgi:Tfp pilus assembly major pilin PilA